MSPKRKGLLIVGFFGLVTGAITIGLNVRKSVPQESFESYAFETPLWFNSESDFIAVRREAPSSNTLLLRRVSGVSRSSDKNDGTTYRYTLGAANLEPMPPDAWEQAHSPIADVYLKQQEEFSPWSFDYLKHQVTANGKRVSTVGNYKSSVIMAPGGKRVAVISAEGKSSYGLWPAMGGGGLRGKYYVELFSKSDAIRLSRAIVFPEGSGIYPHGALWSADGRFFVVHESNLTWVVIIPVERILLDAQE